jgi:hypothetical protein
MHRGLRPRDDQTFEFLREKMAKRAACKTEHADAIAERLALLMQPLIDQELSDHEKQLLKRR